MASRPGSGSSERLDQVLALVREKVARGAAGTGRSVHRARTTARSTPRTSPSASRADLYGAALSHWNFARRREPGTPQACASSTRASQEHGWQSTHTVIEIVNDDMPFLVDSVTMEVNRHGLTLHLIVHPIVRVNRRDASGDADGRAARRVAGAAAASRSCTSRSTALTDAARLEALAADLARVLDDVRVAVEDWKTMLGAGARDRRRPRPPPAARRPGGARGGARVPRVARRRPLHLPRLPRPRPRDEGRRRRARASCPARAWASCARSRARALVDELLAAAAAGCAPTRA